MIDLLLKGADVVDGSGAPAFRADIAVEGRRVVAVAADLDVPAARRIDADGLVAAPGFIDPHTHFDAQVFWDGQATPSSNHGVTTVIAGNCGFTLAPLRPADADFTRRMMARVEGMPLAALEGGVPWDWESFADYLDAVEGRTAVNIGFLVGHCALRRYVMGEAASGNEATPQQVAEMASLLGEALRAGGLGLSTTRAFTHSDGDGRPVPSRFASEEELLELCDVVGRHPGTSLEAIVDGCMSQFSHDEVRLMSAMTVRSGRALNWNVLSVNDAVSGQPDNQLAASTHASRAGGRIVALSMPVDVPMNMSLLTFCALFNIPGWGEVLNLPVPERMAQLADPAVRARLTELAADPKAGGVGRTADFSRYIIGDTFAPENAHQRGRRVADIARERGVDAFTAVVDIAIADELRTVLWPETTTAAAIWDRRRATWEDERVLLGGSDAGAHLDRMCGATYPTRFLADCLRGRKLLPVERAVELMTSRPAQLFGLVDRGRIAPGYHADLVLFDPSTVDSEPPRLVADFPGGTVRLTADSIGVAHVLVGGVPIVRDGRSLGELPGTLLRSGRDTT